MPPAVLGFRVHSGWCALVAIALEEGLPRVLLRERPHLVRTFTFEFRQPYHTAKKKPSSEAVSFIAQVRTTARALAVRAIVSAQTNLAKQRYEVKRCALLAASGKPLPDLSGILASHALIHTADGELFREALVCGCEKCGLEVLAIKEKDVLERAGAEMRLAAEQLAGRLADLGRAYGSPWTQDEKLATLAAWLSISKA
jgi:hypothetical protein